MPLGDILHTTLRVTRVLERLGVDYLVGGSRASSLHGIPRATQDVDLVVEMRQGEVTGFVEAIVGDFYVDEERIREAIHRRASFNIIELETMFKLDVFIAKGDSVACTEMQRRQVVHLGDEPTHTLMVASPRTSFSRSWSGTAWATRSPNASGSMFSAS